MNASFFIHSNHLLLNPQLDAGSLSDIVVCGVHPRIAM